MQQFEQRADFLLKPYVRIADDEAEKLGRKNAEKEVEAFVNANCIEMGKDKWMCPLSGKKFKVSFVEQCRTVQFKQLIF